MPLRHYQGGPKPAQAAWKCPTCHAENLGPIEGGCTSCGAGNDAKHVGVTPPVRGAAAAPPPAPDDKETWFIAFEKWTTSPSATGDTYDAFKAGWDACKAEFAAAMRGGPRTNKPVAFDQPEGNDRPKGEKLFLMAAKQTDIDGAEVIDVTTRDTILAALAFYRDNQLAYGAVPGQLNAEQITELIDQLTPEEPDDNQPPF